MDEVFSPWDFSEAMGVESIATAMFSSDSPEALLKIFLTSLGEKLVSNRVAIYQFINPNEGKILVEAVSPNCSSIKNHIYPINYFGIDSTQNYPCDYPVILSDVAQVTETLAIHQYWQKTQVKAMMSAPILLDESTSINQIWGLAVVQQCDRVRIWKTQEANFLFKLSQILSQCLQYWQLRLRSPAFSKLFFADEYDADNANLDDQEEFVVKRVELQQDAADIPIEIAVSSNFLIADDEDNEILDRINFKGSQSSINQAINLAMQRLDWKSKHASMQYDDPEKFDDVDVESLTLEDVLEEVHDNAAQDKVEYLQQRVQELTESLQQKLDEVEMLQQQLQELTDSQQKFRQILSDLQSENLPQKIKEVVMQIYWSL